MLYFLLVLLSTSIIESFLGILPYRAGDIFLTSSILVSVSWITNKAFAKILKAYANPESTLITALILALIVGPLNPLSNIAFLIAASVFAIASKYILAIRKRHIFNPAAIGVLLTALLIRQGASWWVGSAEMLLFIAVGGFLILAKIKRFTLALVFLTTYLISSMFFGVSPITILIYSPIIFFTSVMLIEPLTSPIETKKQIVYAAFIGFLLVLFQQTLKVGYTLELSLVAGNLFSYFVSSPLRLILSLRKKEKIADNTYSFYLEPDRPFNFEAGQFMHWTLPHKNPDSRGVRRFFTICSSPTQNEVMISLKVPDENPSSFKRALMDLKNGDRAVAIDPAGEFVLPKNKSESLVFIAGGIGITPFISMARWIIDKKDKRDIVLFYSNSTEEEIAFRDILDEAEGFGLKTVYVIGKRDGYIDEKMIGNRVPDWKKRIFYISGPQPMVEAFKRMLTKMGARRVKTDFFPGYTETHQK